MCDDVKNCCRLCLDVDSQHVPIHEDATISLHIKACLSITVSPNDHLPKTVCLSCVSQLNQFYNFQLNARCSQDWLESSLQEKMKKTTENKTIIQPLPDSEYNSDSLLEFLNNTENIEEYLNNLGKEDIPCIVNMLDKNENSFEIAKTNKAAKVPSPKKKDTSKKLKMEVDVTDFQMVKGLLTKDTDSNNKTNQGVSEKNALVCYGCKTKHDSIQKLLQHMSVCDLATRTCVHCDKLFDARQQLQQHSITHNTSQPFTCNCGTSFQSKDRLTLHHRICHADYGPMVGCVYRCKACGDVFKERFQLYKHAREHIIKSDECVCDVCGHKFNGSNALDKHRKEEHEKPVNALFRCKICGVKTTDHKEMYVHVKKHAKRPKPMHHLCESCGKSFSSHASLIRHSVTHGNSKNICSICHKQLQDTNCLREHMLEHIEMAMCEKCGQRVNKYKLDVHLCV